MSKQTHTPGPWRVNGASVWSDAGYVAELSSPRGPDERDANARLVAAAPELLAALERCIAVFNELADAGNYPLPLFNTGGWKFAYDAVAKATGAVIGRSCYEHR